MVRSIYCFACKACIFSVLLSLYLPFCCSRDNITFNNFIRDGETIISGGGKFVLGFFSPVSGIPRRHVGIWYRSSPLTRVWVANRNISLNNSNGVFGIREDGNLVLLDKDRMPVWNSNISGLVPSNGMVVRLLDSGNLVLSKEDEEGGSSIVIWESFKNPTDTFLPGMKMDENLILISWESLHNPAEGKFVFQLEDNQYIIKKEISDYYWKSGVSGKFISDDNPSIVNSLLSNGSSLDPIKFSQNQTDVRLVIVSEGKVQYFSRLDESAQWNRTWWEPRHRCNVFEACGPYASCNTKNSPKCNCLPGFESVLSDNWNAGEFSAGCRRKIPLCSNKYKKPSNFTPVKVIKLGKPDQNFETDSENECKDKCLKKDCNCQAYSYSTSQSRNVTKNRTCWIWSSDLNNIQLDDTDGGHEIHLLGQEDFGGAEANQTRQEWPLIIAVIVVSSVTALACTIVYIYRRKMKVKEQVSEDKRSDLPLRFYGAGRHVNELTDFGRLYDEEKKGIDLPFFDFEGIDLPFFDFESILAATDNFSEANKLGRGGFGPVYKGNFLGGEEIAVKRLSRVSGQGMEEFKNEVVSIARLQHRNLVRLLGYCIQEDEKILLYEFMPNKSLDSFIFDSYISELLDWRMRFNIILGIARGLLYLHQDSRLRIIHRDLKTSNILLDGEMNPKISDFGLAKIFEGKQTKGSTNRVVGTYGYMSPEYALDGFFSVKSDVFSFGIVILEIISGKRNTGFYNSQKDLSLLGYAWRLWQEDKALDIMDQKLSAGSKTKAHEVLKCINVGLLCVQEDPDDRPIMSDVITVLSSETPTLPTPKRPAFVVRKGFYPMASSSSIKAETNNEITVSLEGR